MTMRSVLKTGYMEMASAFMMMRSDRSLLKSRSTRKVRSSRRIDTPGRSGSARLAMDTAGPARPGVSMGAAGAASPVP